MPTAAAVSLSRCWTRYIPKSQGTALFISIEDGCKCHPFVIDMDNPVLLAPADVADELLQRLNNRIR